MIGLEALAAGFALLAPVYGLLFQIQRNIGRLTARMQTLNQRVSDNESEIERLDS